MYNKRICVESAKAVPPDSKSIGSKLKAERSLKSPTLAKKARMSHPENRRPRHHSDTHGLVGRNIHRLDVAGDFVCLLVFGDIEIIADLQVHPEQRRILEITREA